MNGNLPSCLWTSARPSRRSLSSGASTPRSATPAHLTQISFPHLESRGQKFLPCRILSNPRPVCIDCIPIMLPAPSIKIDLIQLQRTLSPHKIPNSPEEQHDRQRKIGLEEVLGIAQLAREGRADGHVELGGERDEDEEETEPGAVDAANGFEGDFVEGAAAVGPGRAEADVSNTYRAYGFPSVRPNVDITKQTTASRTIQSLWTYPR